MHGFKSLCILRLTYMDIYCLISMRRGSRRGDTRKEKSLGLLSRRFVQMFFKSDSRIVTLDQAGNALVDNKTPNTTGKVSSPTSLFESTVHFFPISEYAGKNTKSGNTEVYV